MTGTSDETATRRGGKTTLLDGAPRVINIGLEGFAADLETAGARVVHVAWAPPARGDARLARLLGKLGS